MSTSSFAPASSSKLSFWRNMEKQTASAPTPVFKRVPSSSSISLNPNQSSLSANTTSSSSSSSSSTASFPAFASSSYSSSSLSQKSNAKPSVSSEPGAMTLAERRQLLEGGTNGFVLPGRRAPPPKPHATKDCVPATDAEVLKEGSEHQKISSPFPPPTSPQSVSAKNPTKRPPPPPPPPSSTLSLSFNDISSPSTNRRMSLQK